MMVVHLAVVKVDYLAVLKVALKAEPLVYPKACE